MPETDGRDRRDDDLGDLLSLPRRCIGRAVARAGEVLEETRIEAAAAAARPGRGGVEEIRRFGRRQ